MRLNIIFSIVIIGLIVSCISCSQLTNHENTPETLETTEKQQVDKQDIDTFDNDTTVPDTAQTNETTFDSNYVPDYSQEALAYTYDDFVALFETDRPYEWVYPMELLTAPVVREFWNGVSKNRQRFDHMMRRYAYSHTDDTGIFDLHHFMSDQMPPVYTMIKWDDMMCNYMYDEFVEFNSQYQGYGKLSSKQIDLLFGIVNEEGVRIGDFSESTIKMTFKSDWAFYYYYTEWLYSIYDLAELDSLTLKDMAEKADLEEFIKEIKELPEASNEHVVNALSTITEKIIG